MSRDCSGGSSRVSGPGQPPPIANGVPFYQQPPPPSIQGGAPVGYWTYGQPPPPPHAPVPYSAPVTYAVPPQPLQQQPSEDYYFRLAVEESLRLVRSTGLGPSPSSGAPRDVSTKGQAEAQSYKYWSTGCLSYADQVLDGFYMTDDQFPEICDKDQFPKLADLQKVTVAEDDTREVVCVDHKQDPILDQLKDRAREALQFHGQHHSSDAHAMHDKAQRIQALSKIVAEYFGGSFDSEDALAAAWRETSRSEKKFRGSVVLMLGRLHRGGASRHRALLFKMLADSQHMKCQMLMGRNLGPGVPDDTAMIQVDVLHRPETSNSKRQYCIVDLVHDPGRLIPCDQLTTIRLQGSRLLASGSDCPTPSSHSAHSQQLNVSVSTNFSHASSTAFLDTPTGFNRPKAQSESNLHTTPPAKGPSWEPAQALIPDLIRLDSGPLVEPVDISWAKFPNSSISGTHVQSSPLGMQTVPVTSMHGTQTGAGGAASRSPAMQGDISSSHHGHSHSCDLGSAADHSGQQPFHAHSQSYDPVGDHRPTARTTMSSPFAAAGAVDSPPPPHTFPSQLPSSSQLQPQPPSQTDGALPHWILNQVQGLNNIVSSTTKAVQGVASALSPFQTPSGVPAGPPSCTSNASNASLSGTSTSTPAVRANPSKSFAEAGEPFADLSPFKSAPILPGSLPQTLSQQQQQQQQGRSGIAGVPRRLTDLSPEHATSDSSKPGSDDARHLHPVTAGTPFVRHGHSRSNGSGGSWEPLAEYPPPGAGGTPAPIQLRPGPSIEPPYFQRQSSPYLNGQGQEAVSAFNPGNAVQPGPRQSSPFETASMGGPTLPPNTVQGQFSMHWNYGSPPSFQPHTGVGGPRPPPAAWPPPQPQFGQPPRAGFAPIMAPPFPMQPHYPLHSGQADQMSFRPAMNARVEDIVSRMPSLQLGQSKDWEIDPQELRYCRRIGHGSYGEVYQGEWRRTEVAIKKFLEQTLSKSTVREFKAEVSIMHTLKHPNVVMFMGAVVQPQQLAIVTQYIPRGQLFTLLHQCPSCPRYDQINPKRRLAFARDIAKGMHYLHSCSPPIVHRDLKSANLLVDKDWTIKVCDFGLSQVKRDVYLTAKTEMSGTPEWMAPEVLRSEACTEKCDLYSYGVILYELVTGERPWSKCQNRAQVIGAVGYNKQRLELPNDLQPQVASLITDCWMEAPAQRPSFAEVLDRLAVLKDVGLIPSPSRMAASKEEDAANCAHH